MHNTVWWVIFCCPSSNRVYIKAHMNIMRKYGYKNLNNVFQV